MSEDPHENRLTYEDALDALELSEPRYCNWQDDVEDFHYAFGVEIGETPGLRGGQLRGTLIREEIAEMLTALAVGDLPGAIDGLVDSLYVLLGTAVTWGVDIEPIWGAVHRSNMAKVGGTIRADGKILKPAGWVAPDIAGELRKQGWSK